MTLAEQHMAAWTSRRADETRSMLATAQIDPHGADHWWHGQGKCVACGRTAAEHDRAMLVRMLQRGCFFPAARDIATLLLRIMDRRAASSRQGTDEQV